MDERILRFVAAHRGEWANSFARAFMEVGTNLVLLAVFAAAGLIAVVVLRAYRPALAVLIAVVVSSFAAGVLKNVIDRARPPAEFAIVHIAGPSMPSTHAARTSAAASALVAAVTWTTPRLRKRVTALLACAVFIVGACLVYLGVHWTTDVIVGWALGLPIGLIVGFIIRPRIDSRRAVVR
jgi:membrane-associated phospholipid phosphatase